MASSKIFVIGGAGYIGAHTVKELVKSGYNPIVIDNFSTGHRSFCKFGEYCDLDITNKDALKEVFEKHKPAAVIHFAAHTNVGESVIDPKKYYDNNIVGTLNLLGVMLEQNIKSLVFSSSCAVYGVPQIIPISEKEKKDPINPYGFTKYVVERALEDYGAAYGIRSVCLRYFNAAGADPAGEIGELHDPETHLIPLILESAAELRKDFTIFGDDHPTPDGTCIRDYVHVLDLATAHVAALKHLEMHGESLLLNLGTGVGYSVKQVLTAAMKVTGKNIPYKIGLRRAGDPPSLIANPEKAKEILKWEAKNKNLEIIIEHAWKWLLQQKNQALN